MHVSPFAVGELRQKLGSLRLAAASLWSLGSWDLGALVYHRVWTVPFGSVQFSGLFCKY